MQQRGGRRKDQTSRPEVGTVSQKKKFRPCSSPRRTSCLAHQQQQHHAAKEKARRRRTIEEEEEESDKKKRKREERRRRRCMPCSSPSRTPGLGHQQQQQQQQLEEKMKGIRRRGNGRSNEEEVETLFQPQPYILPWSSAATAWRQPPERSTTFTPCRASTLLGTARSLHLTSHTRSHLCRWRFDIACFSGMCTTVCEILA